MFHLMRTLGSIFIALGCDVAVDFYCNSESRYFLTGVECNKVISKSHNVPSWCNKIQTAELLVFWIRNLRNVLESNPEKHLQQEASGLLW